VQARRFDLDGRETGGTVTTDPGGPGGGAPSQRQVPLPGWAVLTLGLLVARAAFRGRRSARLAPLRHAIPLALCATALLAGFTSPTLAYDTARQYDAAGNLVSRTNPAGTTTFTYDELSRLRSEAGPARTQSFGYDANGNRLSDGAGNFSVAPGSNRYATVRGASALYDAAGNLTEGLSTGSPPSQKRLNSIRAGASVRSTGKVRCGRSPPARRPGRAISNSLGTWTSCGSDRRTRARATQNFTFATKSGNAQRRSWLPCAAPRGAIPKKEFAMSRQDDVSPAPSAAVPPARPKRRFLAGLLTGSIVGGLLATTAGFVAHAQDGPRSFGGRCMHAGWHGHHRMSPEAMRERVDFATDWALSKVKATDEQKTRVKQIVFAAFDDVAQLRETHVANREAVVAVLTAPAVDRARLESLRKSEIELAERASQRITQALADVADVLSPEQRKGLADMMKRMRGPMGFGGDDFEKPRRS
jgi:YD repeat-containing protein